MARSSTHPTEQELADFRADRLSPAAREAIQSHVAHCAPCRTLAASADAADRAGTVAYVPTKTFDSVPQSGLDNHPRYRVLKHLGNGGMGQVFLAEHALMDRRVAIKVIRSDLLDNPDAVARFRAEVKIAAKLDHPNIVRAYDAEEIDGAHLFVMEYVSGASLQVVLRKKGPLPILHACAYMRAAALGLQHAFEKGTVHRDIKPGNIMLSRTGQIKLCDFGLAKVAREHQSANQSLSVTGLAQLLGTPAFLAPEQAEDARSADIRADIYSLGCTMFHLLTGRTPFHADSILDVVQMHFTAPRPRVTEFRPDVPDSLADLIVRMMSIDKADRPQTPKQVAESLWPFCREPVVFEGLPVDPAELDDAETAPAVTAPPPVPVPAAHPSIAGSLESAMRFATRLPERIQLPARPKPAENLDALETVDFADEVPRARKKGKKKRRRRSDWPRYAVLGGIAVVLVLGLTALLGKSRRAQPVAEKRPIPVERPQPTVVPDQPKPEPIVNGGFVSLFNGRDLEGWSPQPLPNAPPPQWTVENGEIVSRGGSGYLVTKRADFRDFQFRMEVKVDEGDSGLLFRYRPTAEKPGDPPPDYYQAQITPDPHPGLRIGTLCGHDANGGRFFPGFDPAGDRRGQWVRFELFVVGGDIRIVADGREVQKARLFVPNADRGAFALESYGATTKVRFRKLEVRPLPDSRPPSTEFVSLLNGTDLAGWHPGPTAGDWKFENGLLRMPVGGKPGNIVHDANDYRDFHLKFEWRFTGGATLLEFRTNADAARDTGYAAQLGPRARLIDLATKKAMPYEPPESLQLKQGEWYTWEIVAQGREIRILLDRVELLKYREPDGDRLVYGRLAFSMSGNKDGNIVRPAFLRNPTVRRWP